MTLSHKGRWFSGPFASCTYTHIMVSLWTLPLKLTRTISRPLKNFIINIFILSLTHTTISTEIYNKQLHHLSLKPLLLVVISISYGNIDLMRRIHLLSSEFTPHCCPQTKTNKRLARVLERKYVFIKCTSAPNRPKILPLFLVKLRYRPWKFLV